MTAEHDELRRELAALTERVNRLEASAAPADERASRPVPEASDDRFWALNGLRDRAPEHPTTTDGAVMLVGSLTLPDGGPVSWQQTAGTAGLLDVDWSEQAPALAALGHPVRLELLRQILSGVHATADLAEIAGLGTTGQLHHHLRQLVASGWVRQVGRGSYEVPAARVVPLLTSIVGSQR